MVDCCTLHYYFFELRLPEYHESYDCTADLSKWSILYSVVAVASRLIDIRGTRNDVAEVRVEDKDYKLEIWDTAGQERFRSLAPMSLQPYRVQGRRVDVGEPRERSAKVKLKIKKTCFEN